MSEQLVWVKSSASASQDSCVEVATLPNGGRAVRDSKLADSSPVLRFNAKEWDAFIAGIKAGEF